MARYSGAWDKDKKGLELFILAPRRRFRSLAGRLFNLIFVSASPYLGVPLPPPLKFRRGRPVQPDWVEEELVCAAPVPLLVLYDLHVVQDAAMVSVRSFVEHRFAGMKNSQHLLGTKFKLKIKDNRQQVPILFAVVALFDDLKNIQRG